MPQPIILPDPSGLAAGITSAGSALGKAFGQRWEEQKKATQQRQYGTILEQTLGALPEDASPIQVTQALTQAIGQGVPTDIAEKYGTLYSTLQKTKTGMPPSPGQIDEMTDIFEKFGMGKEEARRNAQLYGHLTAGGQTAMANMLVDQIARAGLSQPETEQPLAERPRVEESGIERPPVEGLPAERPAPTVPPAPLKDLEKVTEEELKTFDYPKFDNFKDLTPAEKVKRQGQYAKANTPLFNATSKKLKTVEGDLIRIQTLTNLNERRNLPEGLGRWPTDLKTGELIFPPGASADAQDFSKIIADFTRGIKDRFGARITSFEIEVFLRSLPSLAMTYEGRKMVLKQMEAMTKMEKLYEFSLREAYRKYGMNKIDPVQADQIADELSKSKMDELKRQYAQVTEPRNELLAQRGEEALIEIGGKQGYVPFSELEEYRKRGAKVITTKE